MIDLCSIRHILKHNDWANRRLLDCAAPLDAEKLDRPIEMGVGSLRRTLLHIYNGEHVWLLRWRESEPKWPSEAERIAPDDLRTRFEAHVRERDEWLAVLPEARLTQVLVYRDSKGSLFRAALGDMLYQAVHHSAYHRAQAVNMLRQVDGEAPEIDYMMWLRLTA